MILLKLTEIIHFHSIWLTWGKNTLLSYSTSEINTVALPYFNSFYNLGASPSEIIWLYLMR